MYPVTGLPLPNLHRHFKFRDHRAGMHIAGMKWQRFRIWIRNNAGTMQHIIVTDTTTDYADKINGVLNPKDSSFTYTNTPQVNSSTDFARGGGVDAAATHVFIFDTADQDLAGMISFAKVCWWSVNGADIPRCIMCVRVVNVNGRYRRRAELRFTTEKVGAAYPLTTANISSGNYVAAEVLALLR